MKLVNHDLNRRILSERPRRPPIDPNRVRACFVEKERSVDGQLVDVATLLLTNRECPWRCVMCDLWKNTTTVPLPPGRLPVQMDEAFRYLGTAMKQVRQVKLYNSGSFFDAGAVPPSDYRSIADRVNAFDRVIVESHPALTGSRRRDFQRTLDADLEVAMGLETIDPSVHPRLNKGTTPEDIQRAAGRLLEEGVAVRMFVLVRLPWQDEAAGLEWAVRSADFAFECGAEVVTLIPTRPGNGYLDRLMEAGEFSPPRLTTLETALEMAMRTARGRVFADVWDLERFAECPECFPARRDRLETMNHTQCPQPKVVCPRCCF